jgi:DNA-directed RNA polymerase specialized sigma24 family protein
VQATSEKKRAEDREHALLSIEEAARIMGIQVKSAMNLERQAAEKLRARLAELLRRIA